MSKFFDLKHLNILSKNLNIFCSGISLSTFFVKFWFKEYFIVYIIMKKIISNLDYNTMNISELDEGIESTPMITTSRKHKKQETTHFNEYKKLINQQKKKRRKQEII